MTALLQERLIRARQREQAAWFLQFEHLLEQTDDDTPVSLRVGEEDGVQVRLPKSVVTLLRHYASLERRSLGATLVPMNRTLTTQEAADILNVSRPWVVKLIDRGEIEHEMVGNRRRVTLESVLDYKTVRDAERRAGLARLARMDQENGFFDE